MDVSNLFNHPYQLLSREAIRQGVAKTSQLRHGKFVHAFSISAWVNAAVTP
jgi:hypothetical protein